MKIKIELSDKELSDIIEKHLREKLSIPENVKFVGEYLRIGSVEFSDEEKEGE